MDYGFPSEQLSLPHNLTRIPSDTEEDYSPHQPQHETYPDDLHSNGTEVSSIAPGSYSHPFYQYVPWDGKSLCITIEVQSSFDVQPQNPNTCLFSNPFRTPPMISRNFILNYPFPQMVCLNLYLHHLGVRL
jgi:hypothetical protein